MPDHRVQPGLKVTPVRLEEQDSLGQQDHKVQLVVRGALELLAGLEELVRLVRQDPLVLLEHQVKKVLLDPLVLLDKWAQPVKQEL